MMGMIDAMQYGAPERASSYISVQVSSLIWGRRFHCSVVIAKERRETERKMLQRHEMVGGA